MRAAVYAALLLIVGCAAAPSTPPPQTPPIAEAGPTALNPRAPAPRLWYVGIGLYDETWSENDVADVATRLQEVARFRVVPYVFSSRGRRAPDRLPLPDRRSVERTTSMIARRAEAGDVVLVYISTHGAPGLLGRSAAGRELPPVGLAELREWLAPLRNRNTVLVLSACFSGSLIPGLRGDHRIIFTAARADRTSFGCRAGAQHTVFGDAFLRALETQGDTFDTIVARTRGAVTAREQALGVTYPSEPQLFVGDSMESLMTAPVF